MNDFTHLHTHGAYSVLDGLTTPKQAMAALAADGATAMALTDHGTLGGILKYAEAANEAGIKLLPGCELYLSIGDRHEQNHVMVPKEDDYDGSGETEGGLKRKIYEHLTVSAVTAEGWRNLLLIDNKSHDTFYGKPRADYDLLAEHSTGLIAGTGCLGGPVAGQLLLGNEAQARINLARIVTIFGADHVFVEIMDHGIPAERRIIPGLVKLAGEFNLPVVATNDSHYAADCDAHAHDAWLAISASKGTKKVLLSDEGRFKFSGSGYHLRTATEMHNIFDNQPGTETAVLNSLLFSEMAEDNIVLGSIPDHHLLPKFAVPDGYTVETWFHEELRRGLIWRYGKLNAVIKQRARHEEDTIINFGVPGYFLVIADMIRREREAGFLVGAGRGSGAGSIAAYAMGITNIDPIENGLLFERFLNPTRKGLPDFDTDFQSSRQYGAFRMAAELYGADKVARIGTYGNAWAKDALKKMGRVLAKDEMANRLAATIPGGDAKKATLHSLLEESNPMGTELRLALVGNAEAQALVDMALTVEGSASNQTIHACGIIISPDTLAGSIPLRRDRNNGDFPVTEWDAHDSEEAMYVKFDFLAIKDLDVLATGLELIKEATGETVDIMNLRPDAPDDRAKAARLMLAQGRTAGVFQLGSKGITELTMQVQPEDHDDLAAILSLYRPGPMGAGMHTQFARRRRGGEPVDYGVYTKVVAEQEVVATVLGRTLGSIVYQEQLMQLAQVVADFAPGQMADLQKAFSKKKAELMDPLLEVWIERGQLDHRSDGTAKVAFRRDTLEGMWKTFEASSSYLFNASHGYAYAMLTWQMAYLKANWGAYFGAALLTHTKKEGKRQEVLADLLAEGIAVRPPSVNESEASTSVSADGAILLGLTEVKGVGEAGRDILREREANGKFTSAADVVKRSAINSQTVQALAEAGALDEFGTRLGLTMACRALRVAGLDVPTAEWGAVERSGRQRARLGLVVGEHPITTLMPKLREWREAVMGDDSVLQVNRLPRVAMHKVHVMGVVANSSEAMARNGGRRLTMTLEDAKGRVEVMMWDRAYGPWRARSGSMPLPGQIVCVTGQLKVVEPFTSDDDDLDADGDDVADRVIEPMLSIHADNIQHVRVDDPWVPMSAPVGVNLSISIEPTPPTDITPMPTPTSRRPVLVPVDQPSFDEFDTAPENDSADDAALGVALHTEYAQRIKVGAARLSVILGPTYWKIVMEAFSNSEEAQDWWLTASMGDTFRLHSADHPDMSLILTASEKSGGALYDHAIRDFLTDIGNNRVRKGHLRIVA